MGISLSGGPFTYNRFNLNEGSKPDFLDMDKDGDKKETFKKAVKDKKEGKKDCGCEKGEDCDCSDKKKDVKENREMAYGGGKPSFAKEDMTITKEMVVEYLVSEGYASNEVSAEILHTHVSDRFLESIEADITEGLMPLPKEKMARQANKAYGKEQQAVKSGDEAGANKQMQRRIAMQDPFSRKNGLRNKNANK